MFLQISGKGSYLCEKIQGAPFQGLPRIQGMLLYYMATDARIKRKAFVHLWLPCVFGVYNGKSCCARFILQIAHAAQVIAEVFIVPDVCVAPVVEVQELPFVSNITLHTRPIVAFALVEHATAPVAVATGR